MGGVWTLQEKQGGANTGKSLLMSVAKGKAEMKAEVMHLAEGRDAVRLGMLQMLLSAQFPFGVG